MSEEDLIDKYDPEQDIQEELTVRSAWFVDQLRQVHELAELGRDEILKRTNEYGTLSVAEGEEGEYALYDTAGDLQYLAKILGMVRIYLRLMSMARAMWVAAGKSGVPEFDMRPITNVLSLWREETLPPWNVMRMVADGWFDAVINLINSVHEASQELDRDTKTERLMFVEELKGAAEFATTEALLGEMELEDVSRNVWKAPERVMQLWRAAKNLKDVPTTKPEVVPDYLL